MKKKLRSMVVEIGEQFAEQVCNWRQIKNESDYPVYMAVISAKDLPGIGKFDGVFRIFSHGQIPMRGDIFEMHHMWDTSQEKMLFSKEQSTTNNTYVGYQGYLNLHPSKEVPEAVIDFNLIVYSDEKTCNEDHQILVKEESVIAGFHKFDPAIGVLYLGKL